MKQDLLIEDNIVFLKITSWRGISIGAEHWYGRFHSYTNPNSVDVRRMIDQITAEEFNKKYQTSFYESGEWVTMFDDVESLIRAARQQFRQYQKGAKVLVLGDIGTVKPQKILVGPREIKKEINELVRRAEKIGFWESEKEMGLICEQWQKLWPIKYY